MIVAVCPHPPLLLRELTGRHDLATEVRGRCRAAVRFLVADGPDAVVVLGGAATTGWLSEAPRGAVVGYGGPARPGATSVPLSLGVGLRLLDDAGWRGRTDLCAVARNASDDEVRHVAADLVERGCAALLVLGDGSARRGEQAPGYVDARAFDYDARIAAALAQGDAASLAGIDPEAGEELLVAGHAALRTLGATVSLVESSAGTTPEADLTYADDPLGVMYFVAQWRLCGPRSPIS